MMKVNTYLNFQGMCQEALDFYKEQLGAEILEKHLYRESPEPMPANMLPPGWENKIMHSTIKIGDTIMMAADTPSKDQTGFGGFSISLGFTGESDKAEKIFNALAAKGKIAMPLQKTFFAKLFGQVTDRFGMSWMVFVA